MEKKLIGLLDCNNFFVSCERLFRPDLAQKPVIVLSSNDGCVVARSQEVKDIGIPMGVPYFQIKDTVQKYGIISFSSHFSLYRDISRRVFSVMREELDVVEQYSVDEAFFTISTTEIKAITNLKTRVERCVGIPVSIGVASTKTRAKYVSSVAKKGSGFRVILDDEWRTLAQEIPVGTIWGVGSRLETRYKEYQLHTVADVLRADVARLQKIFGVVGVRLQQELAGVSVLPVCHRSAPQQTITHTQSFRKVVRDMPVLADAVAYHVRRSAQDLRSMGFKTKLIRVLLLPSRHGDFVLRGGSLEVALVEPTDDTTVLMSAAQNILKQLFETGVPYQKAGVVLSVLSPASTAQLSLFSSNLPDKTAALMRVIDTVNADRGRELLQWGSRLQSAAWQARKDNRSPDYTTSWSDLVTAKAK